MGLLVICPMLAISNKMGSKNRPQKIKIIMKNRFFTFALEMFLGHLEGVGWSPACEKYVFLALVLLKVLANDYTLRSKSRSGR